MSTVFNRLNDRNIAPYLAEKIIVKNSNNRIVGYASLGNYKPEYGERLYRFAVLSDVHFNESDTSVQESNNMLPIDDAILDFKRAINFISTKPENDSDNIEFVCICGDIQCNQGLETDSLSAYKETREALGKAVYTCTGNHDTNTTYDWADSGYDTMRDSWVSATGMSSNRRDHFTKTHTTSDGKTINDNFYFLSMRKFNMGTQGNMFKDEDIDDLEAYLEEHKNERTFIITHAPFPMRAGLFAYAYNGGYYWLGGKWLDRLSGLSYKYKNTIWFSGHSHYEWNCQGIEKATMIQSSSNTIEVYNWKEKNYDANVWPANQDHERECGWALHVPSCSGVRPIGNATGDTTYGSTDWKVYNTSEFAIVDVYENYIDFRGVSLVGQDRTEDSGKLYYNPIAQYRLDTTIKDDTAKSYDVTPLTFSDMQNMESGSSKDICMTSVSYDNFHLGSIGTEWKHACIYGSFQTMSEGSTSSLNVKGTDVNCDLSSDTTSDTYKKHYNAECQMHAEMRDLVNMRPNQFMFKLCKDSNGFHILNSSGKGLYVNTDDTTSWEDASYTDFDIVSNSTSSTSTSCLVSQTNNTKLLRLQVSGASKYIYWQNAPIAYSSDAGWENLYIYEVSRVSAE